MTPGTSPTLSLQISAGSAIEVFTKMAVAATQLSTALRNLGGVTGTSASGIGAINSELQQLQQRIKGNEIEIAMLGAKLQEESAKNVKAIAAEKAAIIERHREERRQLKETEAAAKKAAAEAKKAEESAAKEAAANATYMFNLRKQSALMEGARRIEGAPSTQRLGVLQSAANAEDEARTRRAGVLQSKAELENEALTRKKALAVLAAYNEDEARTRRLGVLQYKAISENEALTRKNGVMQMAAIAANEARTRKMGLLELAAEEEDRRRTMAKALAGRQAELQAQKAQLAEQRKLQAEEAASRRAGEGTARSIARGAAASTGGMFLTYAQNIPALAGTFALASAIKASVTAGAEFEYQMKFIQGITGEVDAAVTKAGEAFKNMAKDSVFSATEVASGGRILAQAGFSMADSVSVMPSVLKLATVGELEMGKAAEIVAGNMNAFSLSAKDVPAIANSIAKAAAISQTNIENMGEALKQASTVADQYGVSLTEMNAMLVLMAERNIKGSAAGTALANMMRELDPHTQKGARALKALGVEVIDPVTKQMKGLTVLVGEFARAFNKFDPASQARVAQDLLNNRGAKAMVNALGEGGAKFDETVKILQKAANEANFLDQVMLKLSETAKVQMKEALNTLQVSLIEAFEAAAPQILALTKSLKEFAGDEGLKNALKDLVGGFIGLVKAVVDAKDGIILLGQAYIVAKAGMVAWGAVTVTAAAGTTAFSAALVTARTALLAVLAPVAPLLAALGALAAASYFWGKETQSSADLARERMGEATLSMIKDAGNLEIALVSAGNAAQKMAAVTLLSVMKAKLALAEQGLGAVDAQLAGRPEAGAETGERATRAGLGQLGGYSAANKKLQAEREEKRLQVQALRASIYGPEDEFGAPGKVGLEAAVAAFDQRAEEIKRGVADRLKTVPKVGGTQSYKFADGAADAARRSEQRADASEAQARIKRKFAEEEQEAKQAMAMLDMRLKYRVVTEEDYDRQVQEIQNRRAANETKALENEMKLLQGIIAQMEKTADKKNELGRINAIQHQLKLNQDDAEHQKAKRAEEMQLKALDAARKLNIERAGIRADGDKLSAGQALARERAKQAVENDLLPGDAAAAESAKLATQAAFLDKISSVEKDILQIREMGAKQTEADQKRAAGLEEELKALREKEAIEIRLNQQAAIANYNRQREFSYGWAKAFKEYSENANNSAQNARDVFNAVTTSMTDMLINFTKTGKLNFKAFANAVIDQIIRIQAAQATAKIVGLVGKLFTSVAGSGGGAGGGGGIQHDTGPDFEPVMQMHTGYGPGDPLKAWGGLSSAIIATAPRYHTGVGPHERAAVIRKDEGVFTPGQMKALAPVGSASGGPINLTVIVNAETGDTKSEGAVSRDDAKALGELIGARVREVIVKEQRNGGLLSKNS
jgi:TP901 family phage tail tape measure protein/lambda family phage tail tape measure protein